MRNFVVVNKVHPCVQVMLDLSTAHMPEPRGEIVAGKEVEVPDFGGLRWEAHEHGWIVFVQGEIEGQSEFLDLDDPLVPTWMRPIYEIAADVEAILINFDQAAARYPDLPTWEW